MEGQTELGFVKRVLSSYLGVIIKIIPIIHTTKIVKSGTDFKGGVTSYFKIKKEVLNLLADSSATAVTTMFDYYGLPHDFPAFGGQIGSCYERVTRLETTFAEDIGEKRFIPYLQLHEFETLLFSAPEVIDTIMAGRLLSHSNLKKIRDAYTTPEEINDNPSTCPSRRIIGEYSDYQKTIHGQIISEEIGMNKIVQQCKHFSDWIDKIKSAT